MDRLINAGCMVRRSVRDAFAARVRGMGLTVAGALREIMEREAGADPTPAPLPGSARKLTIRLRDAARARLREDAAAHGSTPHAYAVALLEAQLLGRPGWSADQMRDLRAMRMLLTDISDDMTDAAAAARVREVLPLLTAAIVGNLAHWGATAPAAAPAPASRARATRARSSPAAASRPR